MRILAFGDYFGIPQLQRLLPAQMLVGVVGAEIRPNYLGFLKDIAAECSVPFLVQPRSSSPMHQAFVERVRELAPDLIIVHSYSMLIRQEVLAIPRFGGVNIHGALLPQYQGCNPTQWALLNNEHETGVTMHYMDANFDTGDIIAQRRVPIFFEDTWRDIQARIGKAAEAMLAEELPNLLNGKNVRHRQDTSKAHYYKRRRPEDGLIDWNSSVLYIYNLIRALVKPHPGAFYYTGAKKVVLDEYLSLSQVTALKYGAGGQWLSGRHVNLTPVALEDSVLLADRNINFEQALFDLPYKRIYSDRHQEWLEMIRQLNDAVLFAIRLRETNKLVGLCQLINFNPVHLTAELQICICETSEHGHDCETESVHLMLDFAFKDLNLQRVSLHVSSSSEAAIQACEKAGFVREGLLRNAAHLDGAYVSAVAMGILRDDYAG